KTFTVRPKGEASDAVGERRHDPGGEAHGEPERRWQLCRSERERARTVSGLVVAHRAHELASTAILRGQPLEVSGQMLLHLALGLGEEREIPTVPEQAGAGAYRERSRIPEGIQQARAATELGDALRAPGEMVFLFARRALERLTRRRIARSER